MDKNLYSQSEEMFTIPYPVHEAEMVRAERREKRHVYFEVFLFLLFVITNLCWVAYEMQYETYYVQEVDQNSQDGDNNFVGKEGDITNGATNN